MFCSLPPNALRADEKTHPVMPKLVHTEMRRHTSTTTTTNTTSRSDPIASEHDDEDDDLKTGLLHSPGPLSADDLAKLGYFTDCESTHLLGWFIVYEGIGQEVVLEHLLPGSHVLFRVRACSAADFQSQSILVGPPSTPPFPVVLPAVWQLDSALTNPQSGDSDDDPDADPDGDNTSGDSAFPPIAGSKDSNAPPSLLLRSSSMDGLGTTMGRLICSVFSPECRVVGLRPGNTYAFRVRAYNRVGWGPWTDWTRVTTVPGPPAAPHNPPRVQPLPDTERIRIEWDPVRRGNGAAVSAYILEWQPVSGLSSGTKTELCDFQLVRLAQLIAVVTI
ncbi:unnamed protein product [Echinostoma caproni]|uniref:Fibronectin type-III domain-containing protein n=1 Tax=Echinostoma caproni TaxID=27848 RepID=A0A3P8GL97_9TREM|nr:unnamed protein product [Echinostoma caproni]